MRDVDVFRDVRRRTPRVGVTALCSEIRGGRERPGLAVDLSARGLRIERPFVGGALARDVQLELELPGADEIVWAKGIVCFDEIRRTRSGGLQRATGVYFTHAASRDFRLLHEFVVESWRAGSRPTLDLFG
jgi:hypothetical protein